MDPQVRKNNLLMFAIEDQDHTEINRLLTDGADPNFVDANCTNGLCTPLHIAVEECDPKSVEILLRWGAKFDTKLRNHKSPWELAKSDFRIRPIFEKHFRSTPRLSVAKNPSNPISSSEGEYHRRPGSAGISGQLYEAHLMALVYLRLKRLGCKFYLGSNVEGIGNFDDLVVRYRCEGADRDTLLFVQAKHREDPEKNKIKFAAVEDVKGDFSVHTNFNNYLMIREQFGRVRSGGFFEGNFEDLDVELVLYTSAKYEYTLLNKVSHNDLLKTNDEGGILQVEDESEIITNLCKSADKNSVENILEAEEKLIDLNYIKYLANDFLKRFRIYFNQAKEDSVRKIVLKQFRDKLYALEFLDSIQTHWMQSGTIQFLTESCNLFPIVDMSCVLYAQGNSSRPVFAEEQMKVVKYLHTSRINIRLLFEIEDKNHRKMLELLHFGKADANFLDANATNGNSTPLHMAVAMNDPISVQILLNAGAKLNARNNKGETACEIALRLKYSEVLSVVRKFIKIKIRNELLSELNIE